MLTCTNCGAALEPGHRFCPRCAAPTGLVPAGPDAPVASSPRRLERVAFAVVLILLVALVAVIVLAVGFGVFVESVAAGEVAGISPLSSYA